MQANVESININELSYNLNESKIQHKKNQSWKVCFIALIYCWLLLKKKKKKAKKYFILRK